MYTLISEYVIWALQELGETVQEAADMVELLQLRHAGLATLLDGDFSELRNSAWNSEAAAQAAVQTLAPPLKENRRKVCKPWPLISGDLPKGVRPLGARFDVYGGKGTPACPWACGPRMLARIQT